MEWTRAVDGYCERIGAEYWAEPVNAVTNLAFLIAAFLMWRRSRGIAMAQFLCVILGAIGVGSFFFHTYAQVWAGLADVVPIALFILTYLFAVNRDAVGLRTGRALGMTALFFPYAAVMVPAFAAFSWMGSSAGYAPVPLLILIYAGFLRKKHPEFAQGMASGAVILIVSLFFRTVDEPLCQNFPLGTHFLWHVLNGLMLGWMIEVYRRLRLGKGAVAR